ncbi:hypothetical protein [Priestia megaterium]|jgi:hypothetical protein|uniref:hypothetical protein n=1 Tax=Priestia megaterium TaxID=1404 RepID=UPI002E1D1330|nr:hypothetical protein [Priestia megaterium]
MEDNWKKLYARKNEHFTFVEEEVKQLLEEVVKVINNHLNNVHVRNAEIKDTYIDFPDCKITFEIDKKQIIFVKEDKVGGLQTQAELVISDRNLITFVQTEKGYFDFGEPLIDEVLRYLLVD